MMNQLPFHHPQHSSRGGVADNPGKEWFVAKDVAEVLGYKNTRDDISKHCEDKADVAIHDGSQNRNMTIIPEQDVYRLITKSNLPAIEEFVLLDGEVQKKVLTL